jgi:hypothetical protein
VPVARWLRIWVSRPVVGLAGSMFSFLVPCTGPSSETQTYRETRLETAVTSAEDNRKKYLRRDILCRVMRRVIYLKGDPRKESSKINQGNPLPI